MSQPFTNDSFNQKVLRDLSRCAELPDVSQYRVNRSFTSSSSSSFEKIKEAVTAKLSNSFFGEVKLCIDLTTSEGDYERLLTPGLTDCSQAEIKLGIHVDYANNRVWLNIAVREGYLGEYVNRWQQEANLQDISADAEELRRQVIADLESSETTLSFFEKLNQSVQSLLSGKIADFVEGVQVSQKIAKNVWAEGEINRSTWYSKDGEHSQWPQYAHFHPVVGGVSDGVIGEIVGIPVAIRGIYGVMTDAGQREAFLQLFTSAGVSRMISGLKEEAQATLSDEDRLLHFGSRTVIEVASVVSGFSIISGARVGDILNETGESLPEVP